MADRFPPSNDVRSRAHIGSMEAYEAMYRRSVDDNEGFWREQADRVRWMRSFHTVRDVSFDPHDVHIGW